MAVVYTKQDQGRTITAGNGAPVHSGVAGDRYTDITSGILYTYSNGSWKSTTTSFLKKVSYTDDSIGNFVLDNPIEKGSIQVYVGGVLKEEGVDYIVKGPNGDEISTSSKIYYVRNSGLTGGTVIIYGVYDVPYNGHLDGELGGA